MLQLLGRIYTTLSFALPWVAVVVSGYCILRFKENGPQSAGLGPFVVIVLTVLAVLVVNALAAGLLAWFQPVCRVPVSRVLLVIACLVAMMAVVGWFLSR